MALIVGIGSGLFLLVLMWFISVLACIISSRLRTPLNYLGVGLLSFSTILTAILFMLPREVAKSTMELPLPASSTSEWTITDYDWNSYVILPTFLGLCLISFGLSTGLLANFYLCQEAHTQSSLTNTRKIYVSN